VGTGRCLLQTLCLIFCTVLFPWLSRGLMACWYIQSSTYLLSSTTIYRGFPTSAARHSLCQKDDILASHRAALCLIVYLKCTTQVFWGGYGLTFDRLLNIPLFSIHQSISKMSSRFISHSFTHSVSLHVPCKLVTRVPLPLSNYPKALYLFTRSDLKTIVLPVVRLPLILISRTINSF
jgi:hypothetical protein